MFIFGIHFPWFILYRENVLDGTKNSFARKWWGIQPLIKISSPEMSPFAEDFVITDMYIYICTVKLRKECNLLEMSVG